MKSLIKTIGWIFCLLFVTSVFAEQLEVVNETDNFTWKYEVQDIYGRQQGSVIELNTKGARHTQNIGIDMRRICNVKYDRKAGEGKQVYSQRISVELKNVPLMRIIYTDSGIRVEGGVKGVNWWEKGTCSLH